MPLNTSFPAHEHQRGNSQPGSSNIYWVQAMTRMHLPLTLKIEGKEFLGLLDCGADTTVMSPNQWPSSWPTLPTGDWVTGIARPKNVSQSAHILTWEHQEGDTGTIQPFIVPDQ